MSKTNDIDGSAAPLIEHLIELRNRLMWAVGSYVVAIILCFVVAEQVLTFMLQPIEDAMRALGDPHPVMQYTAPQEYFFTLVRISMVTGFAVAFPVISYQLWRFVAPGLYRNEKAAFLPFMIASPVLFLIGAGFAQYIVTPITMGFFLGFADASSIVAAIIPAMTAVPGAVPAVPDTGIDIVFQGKVNESLDISLKLVVAFGICFQLPVLLTLMGKAGMVSSAGLVAVRKYAVLIIVVLAAVVTPPDMMSQLILFAAVYPLYEVSILLIRRIEKRREAELRAEGLWDEDDDEEAAK